MHKTLLVFVFSLVSFSLSAQTSYEWFSKGKGNFNMGNYAMAIDCYNQVMEIEPESWDALYHRGYSFLMKRDYENAVADFTEVLKHREDDEWAYISRGSAYNKLRKYELALSDFNHAITINGDNADAYNNRGWSKKFLGDKIGACNDWHTSKQLGNQEAKIILTNNHCKKKKKKNR
ncbi:MAG: tetratricopeptide repeat protein [Bacteroidia bacterium]|nr:tetratricopeptide repeat protein [Bacteroidia bacterium]NNM15728.1 tetratricopeptide repeat protein [Bacteroidia bacterium]